MMDIVHPTSIKLLHSELMRTTALTPTYHKAFGWKKVVGIAAGAIIPFAAPAIATALSTSTMLASAVGSYAPAVSQFFGSAAGSALVGAGLGAGAGALVGGGPGALLGAVGGGAAGFLNTNAPSGQGFFGGPAAGGPTARSGGTHVGTPAGADSAGYGLVDSAGLTTTPEFTGGPGSLGSEVAGFRGDGTFGGAVASGSFRPADVGFSDATSGGFSDVVVSGSDATGGGPPKTRSLLDKALDNKALVGGLSKLGTQLFSNAVVGDTPDLAPSPEQQAAAARFEAAQAEQARLLKKKEGIADDVLKQAVNINPADRARRARADALRTITRAQDAGLRNLPTGAAASARRRYALDRSREINRAYESEFERARANRQRLTSSAAGLLPTGSGFASSAAQAQKAADQRYQDALARLQTEQEGAAGLVAPLFESFGALSEEERKRLEETGAA